MNIIENPFSSDFPHFYQFGFIVPRLVIYVNHFCVHTNSHQIGAKYVTASASISVQDLIFHL